MKIAFVHEWLATYAGSEKVLAAMLAEYPDADLYSLVDVLDDKQRSQLLGKKARTTFLQHVPFVGSLYKSLLPFMPFAIEQHDLSSYDVVISNSHAVAKGVLTGPDQLHICYCYTPMRYAWDFQHQYLQEAGLSWGVRSLLARRLLHKMRMWDVRTAAGVDHFIACSHYIARRIEKVYRRASTVIYPNVEVDDFPLGHERGDFYLTASRMVPYKKMRLVVEAFTRMPDKRLVVIGAGPQLREIKRIATPNIAVMGYQPHAVLLEHLQKARAFIFASEEDFGIAPIEAQACGTPVLAFGKGGATETVIDGVTGLYFFEQSASAICDVVARFEAMPVPFEREALRKHAEQFSTAVFRARFRDFVEARWREHRERLAGVVPLQTREHVRSRELVS